MTMEIKLGGGYVQRVVTDIHNDLLKLQLTFDLRTEKEAAAIIHFLYQRRSQESFLFVPSPPHDLEKLFVCKVFNDNFLFYNNHEITCIFEETANQQ